MKGETRGGLLANEPAPVVPPERFELKTAGDWVMVRSWPLTVSSRLVALESTKPRFWEGMACEKRRKASVLCGLMRTCP